MSNFVRTHKGFDSIQYCKCCPGMIEDLDHVFRSCIKVKLLWSYLVDDDYLCHTRIGCLGT